MTSIRSLIFLAALAVGGCVMGNTVDFKSQKPSVTAVTDKTVVVAGLEQRGYVLSGDKDPSFVGIRRGGFGNPFNITTRSGTSLATEVSGLVVEGLTAAGIKASVIAVAPSADPAAAIAALAGDKADRALLVMIKNWKSDLYMNMEVDYNLLAQVLDGDGKVLAEARQAGNERLGAAVVESEVSAKASSALKRKLELLLNDPAIVAALK